MKLTTEKNGNDSAGAVRASGQRAERSAETDSQFR